MKNCFKDWSQSRSFVICSLEIVDYLAKYVTAIFQQGMIEPYLVSNPEAKFSRDKVHFVCQL